MLQKRILAATSATASYQDETRRTALKRKRGDAPTVAVVVATPATTTRTPAETESRASVDVTVWSRRLYLSIVTSKRVTSIAEFVKRDDGRLGEVEATGRVAVGDIIAHINGRVIQGLTSSAVSELIRATPRPLVISFRKRAVVDAEAATGTPPEPAVASSSERVGQATAGSQAPGSGVATTASASQYRPVPPPPSGTSGSFQFVQPPPQPAFGVPHPSLQGSSSHEYAASVRTNPWNREYVSGGTQQPQPVATPVYGMQMPMNPQTQALTTTTDTYGRYPGAVALNARYQSYQSHPVAASASARTSQQHYTQQPHYATAAMVAAYPPPPLQQQQQARAAPLPYRTYPYGTNTNYTVHPTAGRSLGFSVRPTSPSVVDGQTTYPSTMAASARSSASAPIDSSSYRDSALSSSSEMATVKEEASHVGRHRRPMRSTESHDSDAPSQLSPTVDSTNAVDEPSGGLSAPEPLSEHQLVEPPQSTETSFLNPNKPSFVSRITGTITTSTPSGGLFRNLQQEPRSLSRFDVFNGEECAVVLIRRPRLFVTLSPLGNRVSVSSFVRGDDGEVGEIEESGKVFVGDSIVAVNGMTVNPQLTPTDLGRLLVSLVRPFEVYFKRASWEALEGGLD